MGALEALSDWPVAALLRQSAILYPLVNAAHILAIGLLFGAIATLDLRLLGAFRGTSLAQLGPPLERVAGTGLSLNGSLSVELTRSSGTGAVSFDATFIGSVRWFGIDVAGAFASITSAGRVRLTGVVLGVAMTWDFDL